MGAREYDPRIGRWLQRDPIDAASGDPNLYRYSLNNPVNLIDPDGLDVGWAQRSDNPYGASTASENAAETLDGYILGKKLTDGEIAYRPGKRGNAPFDKDGNPIEMHHDQQQNKGPVHEMTIEEHRGGDNYRKNHPNKDSDVEHGPKWKNFKRHYWRREWDCGRFKGLPELPKELQEKNKTKKAMRVARRRYWRENAFNPFAGEPESGDYRDFESSSGVTIIPQRVPIPARVPAPGFAFGL